MIRIFRSTTGAALLGIVLMAMLAYPTDGQQKPAKEAPAPAGFSSIKIVEDAKFRRIIDVARDCIHDQDWQQAIAALQTVVNEREDHFVRVHEADPADPKKKIIRWTSARLEANSLIGSMRANGLKAYESAYGAEAKELLDTAKIKDDRELLADVARRFRHTKAGALAYQILAAGLPAEVANVGVKDWPSWRANLSNTGQGIGGAPKLDKQLWRRPLFMDKTEGFNDVDQDQLALARVKAAVKQVSDLKQAVLPRYFPIASQGILVYRTARDVRSVGLKDFAIKYDDGSTTTIKKGEILWKAFWFDRSLAVLLEDNKRRDKTKSWIDAFDQVPGYTSFLYDNTLIGTVATDGVLAYLINDLAVPPPPHIFQPGAWQDPAFKPQELKSLLMSNELHAYEFTSGKRVWDINHEHKDFKDSHFLGLPISVGGKLYVLNERVLTLNNVPNAGAKAGPPGGDSELRLVCIDPTKVNADGKPQIIEPIQVLGTVAQPGRFIEDSRRRVNAVQLAYSDGVLVCPTNAGEVFGIDVLTRSLIWSYPYRESPYQPIVLPIRPPGQLPQPKGNAGPAAMSKWKSAPPALQAGKVVFTAPDADSVHCVNLRDGKRLWKKAWQKGDLYMAGVFDGRVLIVGETEARLLDLKDGSLLKTIQTGDLPSGQGAASKGVYYLPLKKGEILAIDIVKGEIKGRIRGADGAAAPGNLIFYENMVVSQTATEIVAYPQGGAKAGAAKDARDAK